MEGSNSKKKRSNVDSRDKRYSSFSEFSSASSYLNDISVSTLNPSDFSENYSPNKAPQNSTQSKRNQPVKQVYTPNVNKSRRSNGTPNRQNSSRRSTASKSNSTVNYLQVMPPLPSQQKTASSHDHPGRPRKSFLCRADIETAACQQHAEHDREDVHG